MMKKTIASAVLAIAASTASASDLPLGDSASAKVFLQLSDIQQLAGVMDPLLSVPGGAFRIVEGDFLALGGLRIRLAGIDAPAIAQRCNGADGALWECAAEAEDRMRDIVQTADRVECFSNDQDNYGYYVASCKADGQDIGAQLVAAGLAWANDRTGQYHAEQARAQAASAGIWQANTPSPSEWRRAQN